MVEVERANSYAGNSLLRNLAPQDLAKLTRHLEPCEVPVHFIFNQPRKPRIAKQDARRTPIQCHDGGRGT
jgi:hypothetical protein